MANARRLVNGTTYLVTRRVVKRQLLLTPTQEVKQILLYCLAYAAKRYSMEIHAFCFLSNHYHLVLTDPESRLPEFMHWLNKYSAKCINALHGEWGVFWDPDGYSAVVLGDEDAVLEKIVYTICNPVQAELVSRGEDWPGLRTGVNEVGRAQYVVERPGKFFREKGPLPQSETLRLAPLPCRGPEASELLIEVLRERVCQSEEQIRSHVKKKRRRFLGRHKVLRQDRTSTSTSYEPRRGIKPQVASRDKWKRIELLGTVKQFLSAYREALARFLAGERKVVFPAGTYLMRVRFGVRCEPA